MLRVGGGVSFATPGTWDDLRARGVAPEGIQQLRKLHEQLDAARFGGPSPATEAIMSAVDTLAAAARQ